MPQQPPPQSPQPDQPTPPSSTPESTGGEPVAADGPLHAARSHPGTSRIRAAAGLWRGSDAGARSGVHLGRLRPGSAARQPALRGGVAGARGTGRPVRHRHIRRAPAPAPVPPGRPAGPVHPTQAYAAPAAAAAMSGATTVAAAPEPKKRDLTVNKVIAGAGAAATSAVLGSFFGAMGTVAGAALGSVFSAVVTLGDAALARQDARHGQGPRQASRRPHREGGEHDRGAGAAGGRGRLHDAGVRHAR